MTRWIGWLLGIDNATAIDRFDASLAASWAQDGPFWVFLGAAALVALAIYPDLTGRENLAFFAGDSHLGASVGWYDTA